MEGEGMEVPQLWVDWTVWSSPFGRNVLYANVLLQPEKRLRCSQTAIISVEPVQLSNQFNQQQQRYYYHPFRITQCHSLFASSIHFYSPSFHRELIIMQSTDLPTQVEPLCMLLFCEWPIRIPATHFWSEWKDRSEWTVVHVVLSRGQVIRPFIRMFAHCGEQWINLHRLLLNYVIADWSPPRRERDK